MSADLAAKCPKSAGLLKRALNRRPGSGWEMLIPILLELFEALIEQCFDEELEFVGRVGSLNDRNVRRLERAIVVELRHARYGNPRTRRGEAGLIADDIAATCARASDEQLGACYRELAA